MPIYEYRCEACDKVFKICTIHMLTENIVLLPV